MSTRRFPSRRAERKRILAASAMNSFRFEILEQRTCMANDLDASPVSYLALSTANNYQLNDPYIVASGSPNNVYSSNSSAPSSLSVEECLLPGAFETFSWRITTYASDIELCIDPSVGPRQATWLSSAAATTAALTISADAISATNSNSVGAFEYLRNDSGPGNRTNDYFDSIVYNTRPSVLEVPQLVIEDIDEPPAITPTAIEPDPRVVEPSHNARHGGNAEHPTTARKANYVAAIDWNHGTKSDAIVALNVNDADQSVSRDSSHSSNNSQAAKPSDRYGWTGLLAYKVPRVMETNTSASETESSVVDPDAAEEDARPLLAVLGTLDSVISVKAENSVDVSQADVSQADVNQADTVQLDAVQVDSHRDSRDQSAVSLEPMPTWRHQPIPTITLGETDESTTPPVAIAEAMALPLGALLPAESETSGTSSPAPRLSRYWFLAAVPAFFALPRRLPTRNLFVAQFLRRFWSDNDIRRGENEIA